MFLVSVILSGFSDWFVNVYITRTSNSFACHTINLNLLLNVWATVCILYFQLNFYFRSTSSRERNDPKISDLFKMLDCSVNILQRFLFEFDVQTLVYVEQRLNGR